MIYLLSQIGVSLLLAAIFGSMIGWIIHRAQSTKKVKSLQQSLIRQQQQVNQAHTDVAMLTEDFDDLKQRSSVEIESLQAENQKVPLLHQNLEKSQLLVRQMMQKHEAQIRELSTENASMAERLKLVKDREQTLSKLQAELEIERRSNAKKLDKANAVLAANNAPAEQTELNLNTAEAATSSDAPTANTHKPHSKDRQQKAPQVAQEQNAANSQQVDSEPSNEKVAVSSWASKPLTPSKTAQPEATVEATKQENKQKEISEATAELTDLHEQLSANTTPVSEQAAKKADTQAVEVKEQLKLNSKATPAKAKAVKPLFDPVDQHDDLKQIFGIGPVTEKTLNKLGLTSYSQLAELKRHDIEKIADALQIFPGRIERDNWVGSARQQLEAVLEDL